MIVGADAVLFLSERKKTALRITKLILEKSHGVDKRMDALILVLKKIGAERFENFCVHAPEGDDIISFAQTALRAEL